MRVVLVLVICLLLVGCNSMGLNFKFVTSGQAPDNATIVTQTINGWSLKPLAPANLRGQRDSDGNLLIEWTRRGRLGPGLRPLTDVGVGEEREEYLIEIYDGSTLKRFFTVHTGDVQPALFTSLVNPIGSGGDVDVNTITGATSTYVEAVSLQTINFGGGFVEATLRTGNYASGLSGNAYLGLTDKSVPDGAVNEVPFYIKLDSTGGMDFWQEGATSLPGIANAFDKDADPTYTAYEVKVRMALTSNEIKYYIDYVNSASQPFYTSTIKPTLPLRCWALAGSLATVETAYMVTPQNPKAIYTALQQTEDFGSAQSSIKVRVYQISATVGKGAYVEANI